MHFLQVPPSFRSNMSEFRRVEIILKVALLPTSTKYPIEGVKRQLNSMLLKYNEEVGGVPLSFSSIKFPKGKEFGRILAEQYWLHVDVTTKLLVFKPIIGTLLMGRINKVGYSHEANSSYPRTRNISKRDISIRSLDIRQSCLPPHICHV